MKNATFGLFVHEGKAWQTETDERDEQQYNGPWPVLTWLTAYDIFDGNGWGRSEIEEHAEVVTHHCYDVGCGDQTEAVLVEVPTEEALVSLVKAGFELWDGVTPPPAL